MAFFGAVVKPGKPTPQVPHPDDGFNLHLSQASLLATTPKGKRVSLLVNHEGEPPIVIATLVAGQVDSVPLDLFFSEYVEWTLAGDAVEVHISGYYSPAFEGHEGELPMGDDDEDDEGEDEDGLMGMGDEDDEDEDGEFGEMDEDEDEDEDEDGVLGFGRKPKVVIEEVHEEEEQPKAKGRQAGGESAVVIEEIQEQRVGERQAQDATDGKKEQQQQQQQQDAKGSAKAQDKANARNGSQAKEEAAHAQQEAQQLAGKASRDAAKEGQQLQQAEEGDAQAKPTPKSGSKRPAEQPPQQQQQTKKQQQEAAAAQKEEKKDGKKDAKKEQQQKQKEDKKEAQPSPADNGKAGLVKTAEKNVRRWENGFEIQEVQLGPANGKLAKSGKRVVVHYTGRLKNNGKVFDKSGNKPFSFRLGVGEVIKGWDLGVEGMRVGDKRRLVIPAQLAYGSSGVKGTIPGNATLEFDVELVDVK